MIYLKAYRKRVGELRGLAMKNHFGVTKTHATTNYRCKQLLGKSRIMGLLPLLRGVHASAMDQGRHKISTIRNYDMVLAGNCISEHGVVLSCQPGHGDDQSEGERGYRLLDYGLAQDCDTVSVRCLGDSI